MSSGNKFTDFLKKLNIKVGKFFSDVKNDQKTRTLTIVVAAVIVLGAALLILLLTDSGAGVEPENEVSSEVGFLNEAAINLVSKNENDVAQMNITNEHGSTTLYKTEDGSFRAKEFPDVPLTDAYLKYAWEYSYYFGADVKVDVDENADNDSLFGFNPPSSVLTTTYKDGTASKITVGGNVPGQYDHCYVRINDDPTIYSTTIHKSVFYTKAEFATTTIQATPKDGNNYKNVTIDNVTISGNGLASPVNFKLNPDAAVQTADTYAYSYIITMADGSVYGADNKYAQDLFYQLTDITANKVIEVHPSAEALAGYGLAKPKGYVTYDYTVEGEKTQSRKILMGGPVEQFTYIMLEGRNVVFRIENSQLVNALKPVMADMRSTYVLTRSFSNIKAMTVSFDDQSYRFELNRFSEKDDENKVFYTYAAVYNGKEVDLALYQKYFLTFVSMSASSYDAKVKADAEPVLTVKLEYFDEVGKDTELITFTETDKVRQYLCRVNGKGDTSVSEAVVNRIKSNTTNLIEGKAIVEY